MKINLGNRRRGCAREHEITSKNCRVYLFPYAFLTWHSQSKFNTKKCRRCRWCTSNALQSFTTSYQSTILTAFEGIFNGGNWDWVTRMCEIFWSDYAKLIRMSARRLIWIAIMRLITASSFSSCEPAIMRSLSVIPPIENVLSTLLRNSGLRIQFFRDDNWQRPVGGLVARSDLLWRSELLDAEMEARDGIECRGKSC